MAQPNPFDIPGGMNSNSGGVPQHGSTEQWTGTVFAGAFGVTPPASQVPSRATSPATTTRNRSLSAAGRRLAFTSARNSARARRTQNDEEETENRSRERRRPDVQEDDPPLPTGWGARTLALERKMQELEKALTHVQQVVVDTNEEVNKKVDTMKAFVQEVEGRFGQLEKSLPERIHKGEERQEYFVI